MGQSGIVSVSDLEVALKVGGGLCLLDHNVNQREEDSRGYPPCVSPFQRRLLAARSDGREAGGGRPGRRRGSSPGWILYQFTPLIVWRSNALNQPLDEKTPITCPFGAL